MTRQDMPQKYRLEELKPHLRNVYLEARQQAVDDIRGSKEYLAKLEGFADTDRFNDLTEQKVGYLANVEEYLDFVQTMLDKTVKQDSERSFESVIYNIVCSGAVQNAYGIHWRISNALENVKEAITQDNWRTIVTDGYPIALEQSIETEQKQWTDREMNLNEYYGWMHSSEQVQFDALMAIIPLTSSMEKMETFVKEGLDYSKIVVNS